MVVVDKKILGEYLNTKIVQLTIYAPHIALKAKPGQFVIVMLKEEGERIPLTISDKDVEKGTISLVIQVVGFSTHLLSNINKNEKLYSVLGPLGKPTEIKKYGSVIIVGGGVGIAEMYLVSKGLKEEGNYVVAIIGAKNKNLLILEEELKKVVDTLFITTDDGSYGRKGFVTDYLEELLEKKDREYNLVYSVGPIPMMKKVAEITKKKNIYTLVSLNSLMVDGTGMCGCCRVTVNNTVKFTCVDGPEFQAHEVDWNELINRNSMYLEQEKHICKLKGIL